MTFHLEWDDPHDAEEIIAVLESAALGTGGRVRDHGFWDDAQTLRRQVEAHRAATAESST